MKFECTKKDLTEAVEITARIASPAATLPVLQCVVIEAQKDSLVLKATNLEISIEKTIPAKVHTEGVVAIPAQVLLSTLKASRQDVSAVCEHEETTLTLALGGAKTNIKTIPHDDFPRLPHPEKTTVFTLPKESLVKGVRNVLYAASTSLIKPELASVYMYHEDNNLIFVATDSFRLAEKKIGHKTDADIPAVIMPAKNTTELIRTLEALNVDEVEITIDENQYAVSAGGVFVTSRIIDGSFPDYRSILPKESTTEAILLKEDLQNTLKKAQIFSDKFGQVTLHLQPKEKTLTVSARNSEVGEVYDSLEAAVTGDDLDISFNHRYLVDVFQSVSVDSVVLAFAGVGKPLIIRGVSDQSFTYLVMPMNR